MPDMTNDLRTPPAHSEAVTGFGPDAQVEAEPSPPHPADIIEPPSDDTSETWALSAALSNDGLRAAVEAILMVIDEPASDLMLAQVLERPRDEIAGVLGELAAEYTAQGRGFDLREVAGGWRFYTRAEYAPMVERFVLDGQQARLTQAALETLAVVAYRQPVSRARISAVRGVSVDGVIRTLVSRGLVAEVGVDGETGAILYGTTSYFLERLGLVHLDELPSLAPYLPDLSTMDSETH